MKKFLGLLLAGTLFSGLFVSGQTHTDQKLGLPGDNLNLYAVMKLFQESPTLEEFEKKLNEEDQKINNLDLNNDDQIDYIKVNDQVDGDVHNIILQVAVSETENQDVAVFTVGKDDKGNVTIQLTGDEELYGKDYIIEPNVSDTGSTPNPGYTGNNAVEQQTRTLDDKQIVVNSFSSVEVQHWPIVQVIYVPTYTPWHSPWHWGYWPGWWRPWRPLYWDYYYGYHYNYYNYYWGWYRPWPHHRYSYWNDYYFRPHRSISITVNNYRVGGRYQNTYSRPDMRRQGMNDYSKNHPQRPVLRPGINKPAPRPVTRPVNPGNASGTRPITRPVTPGNGGNTRPVTRPVTPGNGSGSTRPTPKPTPRPTNPSTRPAPKPTPRPAANKQPVTRPVSKPATRPAPRPNN